MAELALEKMIAIVPAGAWAVGVSGGADSVALLTLLCDRTDLQLTVVHLDHETRGQASTGDATFVSALATARGLPAVIARRSEIVRLLTDPPVNASSLYRACRYHLFREVVRQRGLQGVILAHHADDQAETILQRLLRRSPYSGLIGMAAGGELSGLTVLRPLLGARRAALRQVLIARSQPHREDASNASDEYLRNRLRKVLADRDDLTPALLEVGQACASLRDWVQQAAPVLPVEGFAVSQLAALPTLLARESARRWLLDQGSSAAGLSTEVLDRMIAMATDAATPARVQFPGGVTLHRRRGMVMQLAPAIIRRDEQ